MLVASERLSLRREPPEGSVTKDHRLRGRIRQTHCDADKRTISFRRGKPGGTALRQYRATEQNRAEAFSKTSGSRGRGAEGETRAQRARERASPLACDLRRTKGGMWINGADARRARGYRRSAERSWWIGADRRRSRGEQTSRSLLAGTRQRVYPFGSRDRPAPERGSGNNGSEGGGGVISQEHWPRENERRGGKVSSGGKRAGAHLAAGPSERDWVRGGGTEPGLVQRS